jgi:hypothetical protein
MNALKHQIIHREMGKIDIPMQIEFIFYPDDFCMVLDVALHMNAVLLETKYCPCCVLEAVNILIETWSEQNKLSSRPFLQILFSERISISERALMSK